MVDDAAAYILVTLAALLYYDYALTLPYEIDRFWSTRSLSWTSTFFYLNRYLSVFGHVPAIVRDFWVPDSPDGVKMVSVPDVNINIFILQKLLKVPFTIDVLHSSSTINTS
ncbi:hypothetical protein C0995_001038 [Termitomyces sp. Mi166|nr:hypothetical protein C0995_001038 [Termitomyces sp. Mi166\